MSALDGLLLGSSALFAWSMGSHYAGAVMGTAYGSGVLPLRLALPLAAALALVGSAFASVEVVGTYAHGLVPAAPPEDVAAALLAAALATVVSTAFRLPTSTIQIYTFSLLGAALVAGVPVHGAGFGSVVGGWVAGPLLALVLGALLARLVPRVAARGERLVAGFVVLVACWSSLTLGSNDVSNAASSLVLANLLSPRLAGVYGGAFMALGVLTWGRPLTERIGRGIVRVDVPLAAAAQLSQAAALSVLNGLGHNASINQTIVAGLVGAGRGGADRAVVRRIVLTWLWSPALGLAAAALAAVVLRAIF